jgi:hypothetical protein
MIKQVVYVSYPENNRLTCGKVYDVIDNASMTGEIVWVMRSVYPQESGASRNKHIIVCDDNGKYSIFEKGLFRTKEEYREMQINKVIE